MTLEQAEADVTLLRNALAGLVGESEPVRLRDLERVMRLMPACDEDKAVTLNAIHALIKTAGRV